MRPSSRARAHARRHLAATVEAIHAELLLEPDSWVGRRALEQLVEATQAYLDATTPRPRGRRVSIG